MVEDFNGDGKPDLAVPANSANRLGAERDSALPQLEVRGGHASDGNFVIYESGEPIWATQTQYKGRSLYRLAVQPDGNLAIYGSSGQDVSLGAFGVSRAGSACVATWSAGLRGGSAPYTLKMQPRPDH